MKSASQARPEFLQVFAENAEPGGVLDFGRFMELALYHPAVGYYRRPGARVGFQAGTDFFTATSSGPLFGELIVAACEVLLGPELARHSTFVEIGVEGDQGVLAGVTHPFAGARTLALGEPIALSGPCIVFSNELFDAQPFRRFVHRTGRWRELGVALEDGKLHETELNREPPSFLPATASEGYVIDAPIAAAELAAVIAAQPWTGLFLAFDYGKSWAELCEAVPAGTARAYFRHTQSNDLLAQPGQQDLTCHVCWDWLQAALTRHGFLSPTVASQESFLVRHAMACIARVSEGEASRFSRQKLSLLQLLHGDHLGQKFQVLSAVR